MFKDEAPRGVLRDVRDAALVKVNAKIVEYSMKDVNRMQRQLNAGIRELGVEEFVTAQTVWPQQIVVTARVDDLEVTGSLEEAIEALAPDGVVAVSFVDHAIARDYPALASSPPPLPDTEADEQTIGTSEDGEESEAAEASSASVALDGS